MATTPDPLLARVTESAVAWATESWQPVTDVTTLTGGWTSTMLALTGEDGEQAVVRLMTRQPWASHAPQMLPRESGLQALLAPTPVPVPVSLAVDSTGDAAGAPAHLMTRLPGTLVLDRCDDDLLGLLAGLLADLHDVDPGAERPRDYQTWAPPAKRVVPEWAGQPEVWRAAFDLLAAHDEEPRGFEGTLLHRDFHLGNVLWAGGAVSGLVDWVEASWGPAALDVAHAGTYLAMLHGPQAAARFAEAYDERRPGRTGSAADATYWAVMDAVGYLPDPTKVAAPWRERGIDISDTTARTRLEDYLAGLLG